MKNKFLLFAACGFLAPAISNAQAPYLGTATQFALFTNAGAYSNSGITVVNGDLGNNAGAYNGFPPGILNGSLYLAGTVGAATMAQVSSIAMQMAAIPCDSSLAPSFGNGDTLIPMTYCIAADAVLSDTLYLDGQGDTSAVFVFKLALLMTTGFRSAVVLINGAQAKNVYWRVGGAATMGISSTFEGTIVITGAISFSDSAILNGRVLSTAGAINLINNVINNTPAPSPLNPLSVTLSDFTAMVKGNAVQLRWQTSAETNTRNFTVERSTSARSEMWQHVGTTDASGGSSMLLQYSLRDNAPAAGLNYYRLRSTDLDGSYTLSAVISIDRPASGNTSVTAFPNPMSNVLYVQGAAAGTSIRLSDITGRIISGSVATGTDADIILTSSLPAGTYFLNTISQNGAAAMIKLTK